MGSPNGIWTSVSGGMAQSQNLDTIANNLANANTTGFKKDGLAFKQYLTAEERPHQAGIDIPQTVFKDSDFYHFDGREHVMVNANHVKTDHEQGALKPTNGVFDLAIEGKGFFVVQTPVGLRFTRAGDFKINGEGTLVTSQGYPVMKFEGQLPQEPTPNQAGDVARDPAGVNPFNDTAQTVQTGGEPPPASTMSPINLKEFVTAGKKIQINEAGQIFGADQPIGTLAIAEFVNSDLLKKEAYTGYSNPNPENVAKISRTSAVRQGFLEASNVNAVSELVELLKANRLYESNMRAIKAYNDMAGKEANEVGKL